MHRLAEVSVLVRVAPRFRPLHHSELEQVHPAPARTAVSSPAKYGWNTLA